MISKLVKFKLSNCNKSYFSNFLYAKFVTLYTMFLLLVLIFLVVLIISIYSGLAFIFTGKAAYGSLFFKVVGASFLAVALLMGLRWLGDSVTLKKKIFTAIMSSIVITFLGRMLSGNTSTISSQLDKMILCSFM